jgi:hypothetical protein
VTYDGDMFLGDGELRTIGKAAAGFFALSEGNGFVEGGVNGCEGSSGSSSGLCSSSLAVASESPSSVHELASALACAHTEEVAAQGALLLAIESATQATVALRSAREAVTTLEAEAAALKPLLREAAFKLKNAQVFRPPSHICWSIRHSLLFLSAELLKTAHAVTFPRVCVNRH